MNRGNLKVAIAAVLLRNCHGKVVDGLKAVSFASSSLQGELSSYRETSSPFVGSK